MLPPKIILSSTQTNRPNYTDNVRNILQTKGSEICRQQEQPTKPINQYYQQQEQAIDDNDDDDDLFDLE